MDNSQKKVVLILSASVLLIFLNQNVPHANCDSLIPHRQQAWDLSKQVFCNLFCFQHMTHVRCFSLGCSGLICSTLVNLCCLMSSGMASESRRLLFGPGDTSRAYSCISLCSPWEPALAPLPRAAAKVSYPVSVWTFSLSSSVWRAGQSGAATGQD